MSLGDWCHTCRCNMSHICMSRITRIHESCLQMVQVIYGLKCTSHMCVSHVTHVHESCHTRAGVMSFTCMSQFKQVFESCCISEWVVLHVQMSCVKFMHQSRSCLQVAGTSRDMYESRLKISHITRIEMSHIWMSHVAHTNEPCRT